MDIEAIAWLFGIISMLFIVPHWMSPRRRKRTADAELERSMGHSDWVIRGGTNEGWLNQNSCYTAGRDRLRTWKPGK